MSITDSRRFSDTLQRTRRDGWTPERQLRFLSALARTRSVTNAARAAGMSRESAYRLRARPGNALFGAAWDKALRQAEGHKVGGLRRRNRHLRSPIFRANPPKVTKSAKSATPRIDAFEKMLRELLGNALD